MLTGMPVFLRLRLPGSRLCNPEPCFSYSVVKYDNNILWMEDLEVEKMTHQTARVLRRSKNNRVIAGVAGGLAEFFGISAFWFRLALFIAFLPGGVPGLLIYTLLWIIIPGEK